MKEILVNVVMVTYNHEKYIAQAIESVLNQKTSFAFQLIIGEDCSTDRTLHICRQYLASYPEKILLIQNSTNLGIVRNYERVFNACTARYIAIIEGDDYWIDEKKLQKQTKILESDKSIGMVHAGSYILIEGSDKFIPPSKKAIKANLKRQGYIYEKLIQDNFIYSITVLFRRDLLVSRINYQFLVDNSVQTIDYAIWLGISLYAKVAFIKDIVGVYRVLPTSISNSISIKTQEIFFYTVKLIVNYYLNIHPVNGFSKQKLESKINEWLFLKSLALKDYKAAKFYAGLVDKRSKTVKIIWSHIKSRVKHNLLSRQYKNIFKNTIFTKK